MEADIIVWICVHQPFLRGDSHVREGLASQNGGPILVGKSRKPEEHQPFCGTPTLSYIHMGVSFRGHPKTVLVSLLKQPKKGRPQNDTPILQGTNSCRAKSEKPGLLCIVEERGEEFQPALTLASPQDWPNSPQSHQSVTF